MAAVRACQLLRCRLGSSLFQASKTLKYSGNVRWSCCSSLVKTCSRRISTSSLILASDHTEEEVKEPSTWFSNLLGYTEDESQKQVIDPEEVKEREALFGEIADMYFAKPRQYPDIKFIEKVVDFLIKHNDDHGVKTVWVIMQDMKLEPPEELIVKMESFLAKAREEAWFK
ncbi:uncharacterized protein LOC135686368 [Rhopilema esculentum]|uniref:uncharacterized protein LOC135686368 n=1 Tax=Rhopilema esculentum TaxID=499914 RepID=UPI0031D032BE